MNNTLFMFISTTSIHSFCSPAGGNWLEYVEGLWNRPDTKKTWMLLHHYPLSRLATPS